MNLRGNLTELIIALLPKRPMIYRFCQHYLDHYRGENNSDLWTNGELRVLQEILPSCRTVFDVGANVGRWAELALQINPSLQLHCFEASRVTFQKLIQSPAAQHLKANHAALGATPGEATLHIFAETGGMNSLYSRRGLSVGPPIGEERVRMITLADYCTEQGIERIDFLKLDVEGHEMAVLQGGESLLAAARIQYIQFEYGGSNIDARVLLSDFFDLFSQYGYHMHKIFPNRLEPAPRYEQQMENFQYQNWVAIHD